MKVRPKMARYHMETLKHRRKHCGECSAQRCLRCLRCHNRQCGSWSAQKYVLCVLFRLLRPGDKSSQVPLTSALEARYWPYDVEEP